MSVALKNPYCTLADVQTETANNSHEDADQFRSEINAASRFIDGYCGRDFLLHNHTITPLVAGKNWIAGNVLFLPFPVISLTKITVDGFELPSADYIFENGTPRSTAQVIKSGQWIRKRQGSQFALPPKIELTGMFGYVPAATDSDISPDLPQEIVTACRVLAAIRSGKVKREFTTPDGNRQVATVRNLPPDITASLNRFRQPVI